MLQITKIKNGEKNIVQEIISDDLYEVYNFIKISKKSILVNSSKIFDITKIEKNLLEVKEEDFYFIIDLAEKLPLKFDEKKYENIDEYYNFYVSDKGEIKIAGNMAEIKRKANSLRKKFEEFQNREFYNIIEISL